MDAKRQCRIPASEKRIARERKTIDIMIAMYCRRHHEEALGKGRGREALCPECLQLAEYVDRRIECCPLGVEKTTCKACPVHCYGAKRREQIRTVMRYAGPRLMLTHPFLAFIHVKDTVAAKKRRTGSDSLPSQEA